MFFLAMPIYLPVPTLVSDECEARKISCSWMKELTYKSTLSNELKPENGNAIFGWQYLGTAVL